MCACRCGARVTLHDGEIRFVQGTPDHPVNRGVLCGKGNAAIMKQLSPAKLRAPLLRKAGAPRGAGEFEEISWDRALNLLAARLQKIRETNPNQLAFFTGRDQMQAYTGLWARQFGTLNWAAHGGLCSVNMAAAGLLTTGFSFWEFGEPDWERARLFLLWGVAEDHASNPIKLGLARLKERGAKIVAINPTRTGYQAIADEWLPIRPGTDGILALSLARELLRRRRLDEEFLIRHTNAPHIVIDSPNTAQHGLLARDSAGRFLCFDQNQNAVAACEANAAPALAWEGELPNSGRGKTVFARMFDEFMDDQYAPQNAAKHCGVPAETIERLAEEMAAAALDHEEFVASYWTDVDGRQHAGFAARPFALHAMRGVSAHANGFQTCRALHLLQALLGAIDAPGSHLARPPYPKPPPCVPPPAVAGAANTPLAAPPLGAPRGPADLAVDKNGAPLRIDGAYSWDAPLSLHGVMHNVLANAAAGEPYPIDTLLVFMANLAWNSSLNPQDAREALTRKAKTGDGYAIPFVAVVDAFESEMTQFADLVLPDTTYFERRDVISLLDRPISEAHAACDAIRAPVTKANRDVRPWQEVMFELALRLRLPVFTDDNGKANYKNYEDFIVRYEQTPGVGFLSGFRNAAGESGLRGVAPPDQWQRYEDNRCFYRRELPPPARYLRFANRDYLRFAKDAGWVASEAGSTVQLYSETLRAFQLAGEGFGERLPPTAAQRERLRANFAPLPFWRASPAPAAEFPLYAITQRPMFMYHSWDSQNAWLRQIADRNPVFMHWQTAKKLGVADGDAVWVFSPRGKTAARAKLMSGVEENTVWTWNAIAKSAGAWGLDSNAREATDSFLLNHLIDEKLSPQQDGAQFFNNDPITGQAAWYDLRVGVKRMSAAEEASAFAPPAPPQKPAPARLRHVAGAPARLNRPWRDVLFK